VGEGGMRLFAIWADGSNYRQNARCIYLFDTSSITDTDTIDSATLSIKVYDKVDPASKAPDSNIYTATPASNTALVAGDYAQTGNTAQCDTAVTYAAMTAGAYADWALNATGLGNISKTGVSKFSNKNANYDNANSAPGLTSADYYCRANGADMAGTTGDPKLVVVHSAGSVSVTVSGTVQSAAFTVPTYTVLPKTIVSPSAQVASFTVPAYTILSGAVLIEPSVQVASLVIPTYSVNISSIVAPNGQTLTFTVPAYTIGLGITLTQTTLTLTFILPTLTRVGGVWTKKVRSTNATWVKSTRNSN
jgi:hypothetical protein